MGRLVRRIRYHKGDLIVGVLKAMTYLGLFLILYFLMRINNWSLGNLSRTTGTYVITWIVMSLAMSNIYGGYEIGRKKSKPIITNMTLGTFFVDLVTYGQLQIMNVNANNRSSFRFFVNPDFKYLVLAFLLQAVFLVLVVRFGNHRYFTIYPPKRCLIVLGSMEERRAIEEKLMHFRLQWRVADAVLWNDRDIRRRIEKAEVVFVASVPEGESMHLLRMCYDMHRDVLCKAQLQDIMLSSAQQVVVDDAAFLEMDYHKMTLWQRIAKRLMDISFSALLLIILSPVIGLVALLVHLEDGGPALFKQTRVTVRGRKFTINKFRTMKVEEHEGPMKSTSVDDDRVTRIGRFLRRWRIDEWPQLWNIFIGDMTFVGPRPEMLDNVQKYKSDLPTFVYREKVKAGLTGYAQIEGKYNTTPEDKLMLDLMYIENFSLWNDLRLILRTPTVLFRKDSTEGFAVPAEPEEEEKKGEKDA